MVAVMKGYVDIIETLIAFGADIDALNNDSQSPLMVGVRCCSIDAIRLLLAANADELKPDLAGNSVNKLPRPSKRNDCFRNMKRDRYLIIERNCCLVCFGKKFQI